MQRLMNRLQRLLLALAMTFPAAATAQDDDAMLAEDPNASAARDKRRAHAASRARAGARNDGAGARE